MEIISNFAPHKGYIPIKSKKTIMKNYFDLTGNVAIVTGCSGGLGVQMAKALANQGCMIVPIARRLEKLQEVAEELRQEFGVEVLPIRCDVTDTKMVEEMVGQVMDHFGRIDILVNNAGTGAVAPAEDITDEQFEHEFQIDLFGSFKVARAVAKRAMLPAKYGRIINIASMYGLVGNKIAPASPYHAAKGGVVNLTGHHSPKTHSTQNGSRNMPKTPYPWSATAKKENSTLPLSFWHRRSPVMSMALPFPWTAATPACNNLFSKRQEEPPTCLSCVVFFDCCRMNGIWKFHDGMDF